MKAPIAAVAPVLTSSVWADAPPQSAGSTPWLVAERRMPTWCREGRTWICSPRGWESTGNAC